MTSFNPTSASRAVLIEVMNVSKVAEEQGEDFEQSQRAAFEYAHALFDAIV